MKKRIVICADGTWNSPKDEHSTNVLKLSRAISPISDDKDGDDIITQQVFYDWGIGSYHDEKIAGATGKGLEKNIMDDYRYIVQNYSDGDEIFLFGFSRGSFTIRSLCGLINNCGILKRDNAELIDEAYEHYKNSDDDYKPKGQKSVEFKTRYCHPKNNIEFVGVWDTVGAMGIPISFLGLFEDKDEFYDTKMGDNIKTARHALAIDEHREDFEPTIWKKNEETDLMQVWFSGAHSNIGGSYAPDNDGSLLSDIPFKWIIKEAEKAGLKIEQHVKDNLHINPLAKLHNSRRSFYRIKREFQRDINHEGEVLIHQSVKERWDGNSDYRPNNLKTYIDNNGWDNLIE